MTAMRSALESRNDDRIVVFYGHAGYGKTFATNYVRNKFRGYRVECCSHWGRKALLEAISEVMGLPTGGNINTLFNAIVFQLASSGRPLMIDEADHLVKNSCIELVRDLHDKGKGVVLLVGEELLPTKLERWPRIHSRIIDPVAAEPCDMGDIEQLASLYCPKVTFGQDWLVELHRQTGGNTRRVCANFNRARVFAETDQLTKIDLGGWGDRGWMTRVSVTPRRAV
ncbi:MAG: ATP-binding protein [Synechococcaceae cyanobacterium]|nr:ATP-binding protein [Synechococcaceae cyanobacterium]